MNDIATNRVGPMQSPLNLGERIRESMGCEEHRSGWSRRQSLRY